MATMYKRRSRLRLSQQSKLIEHFVAGTTARAAGQIVGVQYNTAITFYKRLRELIASKQESYPLSGEVEADESYFGGHRKGQRGRGAAGKVPVFGLLKRGGRVYTDSFRSYDSLDTSHFKHLRINHSLLFAEGRNHINGIENFWNQAKRHMRKFNGVPKQNFYLFLKECEWRFNGGNHKNLLNQLKLWYKSSKH